MTRRTAWAASVFATLAVLLSADVGLAVIPAADEPVRLLDVPYVPQSAALCGGAAVAMVERYWGDPAARAEDFARALAPDGAGIRADTLVAVVRARGWTARPITGTAAEVRAQLAQGRPVIALLQVAPHAYHYVVVLAWANGGVLLHDPASAPYRTRDARDFDAAWAGSGRWALLVLPPAPIASPAPTTPPAAADSATAAGASPRALTGCDAFVDDAIRRSHDGDTAGAEQRLLAARAICPASPAPLRGLAGLRFTAHDWPGAAQLCEQALALDPADAYTWRLLAASRFLCADEVGALHAWNRVSEPRADLARVDGLDRIPYRAVTAQLGLPPGRLLTARAFVRARRRLAEIPAQSSSRLALRPLAEGSAQVDASLLERPLLFAGPLDAAGVGLRALLTHEASLRLANPTGYAELWSLGARWQHARPRASLGLAIPAGGGRPGIWRVDGSWERQAYARAGAVAHEEEKRSALAWSDWIAPSVRLESGAALDRWADRGAHIGLESRLDVRAAGDRLALFARAGRWASLARGAPFGAASLGVRLGPRPGDDGGWRARAGVTHATRDAPLALWPGAGTGSGRDELLRAHPLLSDGVMTGAAFGRSLVDLGLEREALARTVMSTRLGLGAFVDAARAWERGPGEAPTRWLVDGGVSLRVAAPGAHGALRVSAAHGFVDGKAALSCAWEER